MVALQFIQTYGYGLAQVHGEVFFPGGDVHKPVAMAHVLIGETEFFRAEEEGAGSAIEMPADDWGTSLQAMKRVLQVAMADGRGSDDEGAIGNGFRHGGEFPGIDENVGGTDGGPSVFEGHFVRIHHPQVEESEVAHGAGGGADVERIARVDEDDAKIIEFGGSGQGKDILSASAGAASCW